MLYFHSSGDLRSIDVSPAATDLNFEVGAGSAGTISSTLEAILHQIKGIGAYALSSTSSAAYAASSMKENIAALGALRGTMGASMSRLGVAHSILDTESLEFASASSRIRDADVGEEAAQLVRKNILQQAGTAVLAQAKRAPELALSLLSNL